MHSMKPHNEGTGLPSTLHNSLLGGFQTNAMMEFRTGNIIIDMIISSLIICIFGYIGSLFSRFTETKEGLTSFFSKRFSRKKSIMLIGERTEVVGRYYTKYNYTYTFKAILNKIKEINFEKSGIKHIKECEIESRDKGDNKTVSECNNVYIVDQSMSFTLAKGIFGKVTISEKEKESNSGSKLVTCAHNKYEIEVFSYTKSLSQLHEWLGNETDKYLKQIKSTRYGKQFVYTLMDTKSDECDRWHETEFISNRTFSNMFADDLNNLIKKLDYFLSNKDSYDRMGIPYTFGALFFGKPGTGKTSAIKAIANYTKRHLVVIPLSKIKTTNDMFNVFFESKYVWENNKNDVDFQSKIILFEDVDCMSEIIHKRDDTQSTQLSKTKSKDAEDSELSTREMLKLIMDGEEDAKKDFVKLSCQTSNDDKITLSFILNLLDGIRETPGRIIIMTTNHPEKIDPALLRPGRIDMMVNFGLASLPTIIKIYKQIFDEDLDEEYYPKIKSNHFSPAEIYNMYFSTNTKQEFLSKIMT